MNRPLTLPQVLLLAARDLPAPFCLGDLAVAAWRLSPAQLRLKTTLLDCPDHHRVSWTVHGKRGLTERGWLAKVGSDAYEITATGRAEADRIAAEPKRAALRRPQPPGLPRPVEKALVAALDSRAFGLYQMGLGRDVSWLEAVQFWGGDAAHAPSFPAMVEGIMGNGDLVLRNRRAVSAADLHALLVAHGRFAERFRRQLDRG